MNDTNKYYQDNALSFYSATVEIDMSVIYQQFLPLIPEGGLILDAGCGSGRDSLHFKSQGYDTTAIDASAALCTLAGELLHQDVYCLGFEDITWQNQFNGVWACASLLHVPKQKLPSIMTRLAKSLKPDGVMYASFKYGDAERVKGGRAFTDMTEESFEQLLKSVPEFNVKKSWVTVDRRVGSAQNWLNVILNTTDC